jgi:hypothetical protein
MNFQSIKSMIESLIKSYKCPECWESINDTNVDIMWAAWTTINIDIECFKCWKHSMVKTEVLAIDLSKKWISKENIEKLRNTLLNSNSIKSINSKKINDEEIMSLNKDLKKWKLNVSDLLG